MEQDPQQRRNRRTVIGLSLLVLGMFGFGFAMVPLYNLVCEVTGIQTAGSATRAVDTAERPDGRMVTVKFDATVHQDLPWVFAPEIRSMQVPVGTRQQVSYRARNLSHWPVTGQAIPAVVPWQATNYFTKAECFCFTRQTLGPEEDREMPLVFMVSPDLPEGIDSLTLSYTFMNVDAATDPNYREEVGDLPTISGG